MKIVPGRKYARDRRADILHVKLDVTPDFAQRSITGTMTMRIAELRDERLTDDKGSFEVYAKLLPLAPGDVEARTRYLEGVVSFIEVLDAERNLFAAEQQLLSLRRAYADNLVALYVALGGGVVER